MTVVAVAVNPNSNPMMDELEELAEEVTRLKVQPITDNVVAWYRTINGAMPTADLDVFATMVEYVRTRKGGYEFAEMLGSHTGIDSVSEMIRLGLVDFNSELEGSIEWHNDNALESARANPSTAKIELI